MTFSLEMQSARDESDSDCRFTRTARFKPLDEEFRFTIDVAATAESAKCARFYTKEDDGLRKNWKGERVWCNPPWSDIGPWVDRATYQVATECPLVVMLLPTRTDQAWWHRAIEPHRDGKNERLPFRLGFTVETRFLPGRERFGCPGDPEGLLSGSPNFWCVLVIWRRAAR